MALQIPDSMDNLVYFSRRKLADDKGPVIAWVKKSRCAKCKKGLMGKPVDAKTGKIRVRATEYQCDQCGTTEEKKAIGTFEVEIRDLNHLRKVLRDLEKIKGIHRVERMRT